MKTFSGSEQDDIDISGSEMPARKKDWFAFTEASRRVGDYRLLNLNEYDLADMYANTSGAYNIDCQIEQVPGLCLEQYEQAHVLAYGDIPRRISCETALANTAFTLVLECHVVNAPEPKHDTTLLDEGMFCHIYESEETLRIGAIQVGENTWISSPARSLLDCGYYDCSNRVPDWIISAVRIANFRADEIVELSEQIGMQDSARRIASIASLLSEKDTEGREWLKELAEYASQCATENIWLDMAMSHSNIYWADEKFGVLWNAPPEPVRRYCYY